MHATDTYWLRQWIDAHGVVSIASATLILGRDKARKDLHARAAAFVANTPERSNGPIIVAGRALDLSGDLDVYAWDMMRRQVDELFSRVWHYFDYVLIVGADARDYTEPWENEEAFERNILLYVQLLLYLREIGADNLVRFIVKPEVGNEEFQPQTSFVKSAVANEKYLSLLATGGELSEVQQHNDHFHYTFNHPLLEHTQWGVVFGDSSALSRPRLVTLVSQAVIARFASRLSSDLDAAKVHGSALGIGIQLHAAIATTESPPSSEQVMFDLRLPTIDGIDPAALMKLRQDEHPHFAAFRNALRLAAKERLTNTSSTTDIAREIERDVIGPALTDLQRRLQEAERVLAKKAALRIGMGALATTCGVVSANPLLVTAGVGTVLSALGPLDSHADARKDAILDDMYFLFRASKGKRRR
ncbi:MAG: hypothetical protein JWO05_2866 [Gemmatimonadetes bacterium]|nr:hypothetical protein [Gemmatimonadota bacterium]